MNYNRQLGTKGDIRALCLSFVDVDGEIDPEDNVVNTFWDLTEPPRCIYYLGKEKLEAVSNNDWELVHMISGTPSGDVHYMEKDTATSQGLRVNYLHNSKDSVLGVGYEVDTIGHITLYLSNKYYNYVQVCNGGSETLSVNIIGGENELRVRPGTTKILSVTGDNNLQLKMNLF